MKAQTAFIRTNGAAHLNAQPAIDLKPPLIVRPRHPKQNDALRLDEPL